MNADTNIGLCITRVKKKNVITIAETKKKKKITRRPHTIQMGLVYLFNGMSTPYGLFKTEAIFHCLY